MFAIGGLSCLILLFVCIFVEKRCERSGGFWGVQPEGRANAKYTYDMEYPNPKTASIEDYEKFLQEEYRYIPLWWDTVQKAKIKFTPEQTKLVEDFLAAGKYLKYPDPKTATVKEFMDFLFDHSNSDLIPEWWDVVQKAKIEFPQWQIISIKNQVEIINNRGKTMQP